LPGRTGTSTVATSHFGYDPSGRITSLDHDDSLGNPIANYAFHFNAAGQLLSQTDHGDTRNYTYDDQGQLTGDGTNTYDFDSNGNRSAAMGYTTGPGNRLLSDGVWNFTYDDEGNETKKVNIATGLTWTYGYDNKNHLIEAERRTTDGGTLEMHAEYKYDVFGNRSEKDIDEDGDGTIDAVQKFAYDGWNPAKGAGVGLENWDVWAELAADGSLTTRYFRGDAFDQLFARLDNDGSTLSPFWYLSDHLGSIRDIVDGSGTLKDAIKYDSFGNITEETDPSFGGRYGWTGREIDKEIDLQFNRARYYDPTIGRWISQDPLGFDAGDSNLYRYVKNQPGTNVDPSGLESPSKQGILSKKSNATTPAAPSPAPAQSVIVIIIVGAPQKAKTTPSSPDVRNFKDDNLYLQPQKRQSLDDFIRWSQLAGPTPESKARAADAEFWGSILCPPVGMTRDSIFLIVDGQVVDGLIGLGFAGLSAAPYAAPAKGLPTSGNIGAASRINPGGITLGPSTIQKLAGTPPNINPGFPGLGRTQNCVHCVIATEYTFAGRPSTALPSLGPNLISMIEREFGGTFMSMASRGDIEAALTALGPGARGIVFGARPAGTGHVFNAVVNRRGVVVFFDGQIGGRASFQGYNALMLLITHTP